jgi:hypothetical protein
MPATEAAERGKATRRSAALTATLIALPVALLVWLAMFWSSGGFGGDEAKPKATPSAEATGVVPVELSGTADEQTETYCRALLAKLPKQLGSHPSRPVSPTTAAERAAAWGDPPIVLRCGVGAPATTKGVGQVLTFNGVSWLYKDGSNGTLIVQAIGRKVAVELDVPPAYAGSPATLLGPLTSPLTSTIPAG